MQIWRDSVRACPFCNRVYNLRIPRLAVRLSDRPTVRPSDCPTARSNRVCNLRILPGSGRRLTLQCV